MKRALLGATLTASLLLPGRVSAQADHLEYLQTPQLVECDPHPYFRVIVNAVGPDRRPAGIAISTTDLTKAFRVFEGSREHKVVYVSTSNSGAGSGSQGSYIMLLFDTSGSMKKKLASGETRFAAAKAAVKSSLASFTDGVDHIAVVPFDSHDVLGRISRATFQSTRAGVEQQVDAIPPPRADTAIYSAVRAALERLKQLSDSGSAVSLVVFSDGANDVNHPGNDPGLLGDEGLAIVRDLAATIKVPVITVGFGITGDAKAETAFRGIAWPNAENYYDAATNPQRLREILEGTRKKLSDQIHILFGPVRESRSELAGQPVAFRVQTTQNAIASRSEPAWNPPALGTPLSDTKCTLEEASAIAGVERLPQLTWLQWLLSYHRVLILVGFSGLLAALWFGVPRFVWPDRYVPKPVMPPMPATPSSMRPERPRMPSPPQAPSPGGYPRPSVSNDQTVFISPPGQSRPPAAPPRSPARAPDARPRDSQDETVFIPPPKNPRRDQ